MRVIGSLRDRVRVVVIAGALVSGACAPKPATAPSPVTRPPQLVPAPVLIAYTAGALLMTVIPPIVTDDVGNLSVPNITQTAVWAMAVLSLVLLVATRGRLGYRPKARGLEA